MSLFGNYTKEDHTHELAKIPEIYWKFRYPSAEDETILERFMRKSPTTTEIFVLELAITFAETNLGQEDDKPFLTSDAPLGIKQTAIGAMPHELILELAEALNGFAGGWGAETRKKE
jgi:hypothetical protein